MSLDLNGDSLKKKGLEETFLSAIKEDLFSIGQQREASTSYSIAPTK